MNMENPKKFTGFVPEEKKEEFDKASAEAKKHLAEQERLANRSLLGIKRPDDRGARYAGLDAKDALSETRRIVTGEMIETGAEYTAEVDPRHFNLIDPLVTAATPEQKEAAKKEMEADLESREEKK